MNKLKFNIKLGRNKKSYLQSVCIGIVTFIIVAILFPFIILIFAGLIVGSPILGILGLLKIEKSEK